MSDDEDQAAETDADHDEPEDDGHDNAHDDHAETSETERDRMTSPMQDYSTGQVTTGFVVLLVGLGVAYALPSLL